MESLFAGCYAFYCYERWLHPHRHHNGSVDSKCTHTPKSICQVLTSIWPSTSKEERTKLTKLSSVTKPVNSNHFNEIYLQLLEEIAPSLRKKQPQPSSKLKSIPVLWRLNNQHVTSVGQRKSEFRQDSNLWPPKHQEGALSTKLRKTHGQRGHILGSYLTRVLHTARISPPCVWDVIGSNPVGDSDFFFAPRSWHADYFIFTFLLRGQNLPSFILSLLKSCGCPLHFWPSERRDGKFVLRCMYTM